MACLIKRRWPKRSDHLRVIQRIVNKFVQLPFVILAANTGFGDSRRIAYLATQITDVLGKLPCGLLAAVVGKAGDGSQFSETLRCLGREELDGVGQEKAYGTTVRNVK